MDADTVLKSAGKRDLRTQLFWARSQRTRGPDERLLLYELVSLADGERLVSASGILLSGLTGLPTNVVHRALERMERKQILIRSRSPNGDEQVLLAFPPSPPADEEIASENAHVRARGDR